MFVSSWSETIHIYTTYTLHQAYKLVHFIVPTGTTSSLNEGCQCLFRRHCIVHCCATASSNDCRSGATGDLRHTSRIQLAIVWRLPPCSDLISQRDFPIGICGPLRQHALLDALSRVGVSGLMIFMGKTMVNGINNWILTSKLGTSWKNRGMFFL